jgi:hypothetical protein
MISSESSMGTRGWNGSLWQWSPIAAVAAVTSPHCWRCSAHRAAELLDVRPAPMPSSR